MSESPDAKEAKPRGRGRPRGRQSGTANTRAAIAQAAAAEFAERGYEAASLRAIARRAGVDPALVHHYFDDTADLFAETIQAPFRPDRVIPVILAGPRERVGENIARFLLTELASPSAQTRAALVVRTAVGHNPASRMLKEFLVREVFHRIAVGIEAPDAALRANLAASQVVGLILTRYILKFEPIASTPAEELVARIGPVLQWHLVDYAPGVAIITGAGDPTPEVPLDREGPSGE